jgi:acetyl-CoA acetyltransferase
MEIGLAILKLTRLTVSDIDVFGIDEAVAVAENQGTWRVSELGLDLAKINPNGDTLR